MRTIAGIDDIGIYVFTQKDRSTRTLVPHHHHVNLHRRDVVDRIEQVSPFFTEEPELLGVDHIGTQSFSASSNDILVRVEFSKNILATVISRKDGTFLIGRLSTSIKVICGGKMS